MGGSLELPGSCLGGGGRIHVYKRMFEVLKAVSMKSVVCWDVASRRCRATPHKTAHITVQPFRAITTNSRIFFKNYFLSLICVLFIVLI
jgi:hypothetical protein